MSPSPYCDGIRRRDFLHVGSVGVGGLSLSSYLRMAAAGEVSQKSKAGILIYLTGGPSHIDTFDLKPEAPEEYRGEFKPVKTNVPGVEISEHLPKLSRQADKFAILRGVSHTLAAHQLGRMYLNTGNRPLPSLTFPGYGSVVAREFAGQDELPKNVAVPNAMHPAGYLGVRYSALATGGAPRLGQPFSIRGMSLGNGLTVTDVARRQNLLSDLDTAFQGFENEVDIVGGLDKFGQQAHSIITSKWAREAFDVSREPAEIAKQFGEESFGQSCLLATRLVEHGVRFVTVGFGGWDTHQQNFPRLKDNLLPQLDAGVASMLEQLASRGLLDTTSVMVTGEFGRTPKVNQRSGRDHYPRAMTVLLAGGGMRGGQVIGESDEKGTGPKDRAISPDSVAASFYHSLGIDPTKEYHTSTGRPVMIVRNGEIIPELFG